MDFLTKTTTFFKEVWSEIKKVDWPDRNATVRYTLIVIGVSVAVAVFLGGLDFIITRILERFVL